MAIKIINARSNFEREPLVRPFGFKGGYMSEIWQTAVMLESPAARRIGLATQNALWSDATLFSHHSPAAAESCMYLMTEYGLKIVRGASFDSPIQLLEEILDKVHSYGKMISGQPQLRKTFALNALVAIDNAAWLLYAAEKGLTTFDEMIPAPFQSALSGRHTTVASIPLMSYAVPVEEVIRAVEAGYFFVKIKIGQPGSQQEMLGKDIARITAIHHAIGQHATSHTTSGRLPYYFDANGRYESKELLLRLLDHADKIGALGQIAIIEEPFPEECEEPVFDLPVRIAADESAHTDAEALARIQLGYGAIALKAIAKTLSMTLKIAQLAHAHKVPCFCADLTVNPILVDWNKNVAARLPAFPGLQGMGLLETNGRQNYRNWQTMQSYHPCAGATWLEAKKGLFELGDDFYQRSGGIYAESKHYRELFE